MKLDALTKEELINFIREKISDLNEDKIVYEILKKRQEIFYKKVKETEQRRDETREWFYSFLKQFNCQERVPGRREYTVPRGIMKENEEKIKEYQDADREWWEADRAWWVAYLETEEAFKDVYMKDCGFSDIGEDPFKKFDNIFKNFLDIRLQNFFGTRKENEQ